MSHLPPGTGKAVTVANGYAYVVNASVEVVAVVVGFGGDGR